MYLNTIPALANPKLSLPHVGRQVLVVCPENTGQMAAVRQQRGLQPAPILAKPDHVDPATLAGRRINACSSPRTLPQPY